jgi:hypothetical protein
MTPATHLSDALRALATPTVRFFRRELLGALLLSGSAASQSDRGFGLDDARFAALHAQLCTAPPETWESVSWRIDLLAAQHEAAAAKKPLFVWAMDGHPLACT